MQTRTHLIFAAATLASLVACGKQEHAREIDWAKAALARNPAFEIVATDETTGVFTVRDTVTGKVRTMRLEELIATPLPARGLPGRCATGARPSPSRPTRRPSPPCWRTKLLKRNPSRPRMPNAPAQARRSPKVRATASRAAPRKIRPRQRRSKARATASRAQDPNHARPRPRRRATASNVERRSDPIICQGDRLMRIDGETLEFTGDALIAEKGCDLYITNAHISAGGVGIIARQARVHIVNSTIGGTRGSYEASEGAEIYVARIHVRRHRPALRHRDDERPRRQATDQRFPRIRRFDDLLHRRPGRRTAWCSCRTRAPMPASTTSAPFAR